MSLPLLAVFSISMNRPLVRQAGSLAKGRVLLADISYFMILFLFNEQKHDSVSSNHVPRIVFMDLSFAAEHKDRRSLVATKALGK
jgi:hypothetical protein